MQRYRVAVVVGAFGLTIGFGLGSGRAEAQERRSQFVPADEAAIEVEITAEPTYYDNAWSDGRTELSAVTACSDTRPRKSDVVLGWRITGGGADAVRVDITRFGRGFADGKFLTSGVRGAAERELYFADAEPGLYYYWRVLRRGADSWVVAANGRFEAPICPRDGVVE